MLSVTRREHDAPTLVERPQSNPIFDVQRLLTHGHDRLLPFPALPLFVSVWHSVRPEPGALFWHDCAVLGEENQDECVELGEVRGIRRIFVSRGQFVVDGC